MTNDHNFKLEFPNLINEAATPVVRSAGETLASLWNICFGSIDSYSKKLSYKRDFELNDYKQKLESEVQNIPVENLQEPKLSIIGPAFEASKFYFEEEEFRHMFAKLISASMDSSKNEVIRKSFTSIIKDLEPIDAQNLSLFKTVPSLPICEYSLKAKDTSSVIVCTNVFLSNPRYIEFSEIQSSSISNLIRLGLITVEYGNYLTEDGIYDIFEKTIKYKEYINQIESNDLFNDYEDIKINKGIAKITPLGKQFISICL